MYVLVLQSHIVVSDIMAMPMMESGPLPGQSTAWRRRVNRPMNPWWTSITSKLETKRSHKEK